MLLVVSIVYIEYFSFTGLPFLLGNLSSTDGLLSKVYLGRSSADCSSSNLRLQKLRSIEYGLSWMG
jgi:hypothetical protein